MGKAMMLGGELTSLEGCLNEHQRNLLRQHVDILLTQLDTNSWLETMIDADLQRARKYHRVWQPAPYKRLRCYEPWVVVLYPA